MSVRVHELAKHCGLSNKEMIAKLRTMNYPVKTHSSTVDKITAEAIEIEHGYVPPAPPAPAAPEAPPAESAPAPVAPPAEPAPAVAPTAAPGPA
ncbi:translation initiation factor IF-2 N-terminal domain-containing protein, partial [bacterium]|nr:translation initiation factor IF-2 N-terminal domain-containing protein [bacterium]